MKKRLPVFATLLAALGLCVDNLSFAIRITMPWFILLTLVPNLIFTFSQSGVTSENPDHGLSQLAEIAISTIGWCSIAVLWHWRILRDHSQGHMMVTFDRRVWHYLARIVLIYLIVAAITLFVSLLSALPLGVMGEAAASIVVILALVTAIVVFAMIVIARLCVALPPIALDVPNFGLRQAWSATEGNSLRLLLVTLLPFIPIAILSLILLWLSIDQASLYSFAPGMFLLKLVIQALGFAVGMVGLTVLTLNYAFFADAGAVNRPPATIGQDA